MTNKVCSFSIAANVQGLAMWRYSVLRMPEPLFSKVNEDENTFYCLALFVKRSYSQSMLCVRFYFFSNCLSIIIVQFEVELSRKWMKD